MKSICPELEQADFTHQGRTSKFQIICNKFELKMRFLTLFGLFLFASSTFAGLINYYDLTVNPSNINQAQNVTLQFSLTNQIRTDDYLRIIWPYEISVNNSTITGSWGYYSSCGTLVSWANMTTQIIQSSNSLVSFVQFYLDSTLASLQSQTVYYLQFTTQANSNAQFGFQSPVQIATVSGTDLNNSILYDSNTAFTSFYLGPSISSLLVTVQTSSSNVFLANEVFQATFAMSIVSVTELGRISIQLTNSIYSILPNSCESTTNAEQLAIEYIEYSGSGAVVHLNSSISGIFRLRCEIQNPSYPSTTQVTVSLLPNTSNTVLQETTVFAFQVAPIQWQTSQIKVLVGWGVDLTNPTTPDVFGIYTDSSSASDEKWYNNIRIRFRPPQDLPICTKIVYQTFTLTGSTLPKFLKNSIYHNFQACNSEGVIISNTSTGNLIFSNVGPIYQLNHYEIGFKVNIPAGVISAINLGEIKIETTSGITIVKALSNTEITSLFQNPLVSNIPLNTATSVFPNTSSLAMNSGSTNLVSGANAETFILSHDVNSSFISPTSPGLEYYTSYSVQFDTVPNCELRTSADVIASDSISFCNINTETNSYTKLQFAISVSGGDVFGSTTDKMIIQVKSSTIEYPSDFTFISEQTYDFYGRSVTGLASIVSTPNTFNSIYWFFNAYCLSLNSTTLTSLSLSIVNWWTPANSETLFPTMIRINGSLSSNDIAESTTLILFFSNIEPYSIPGSTNQEVSCNGIPSGIQCHDSSSNYDSKLAPSFGYSDLYTHQRLYIELPESITNLQEFNIYIPGLANQTSNLEFWIGMGAEVTSVLTQQKVYQSISLKRLSIMNMETITSMTPRATVTRAANTSDMPGVLQPMTLQFNNINVQRTIGSGLTICSSYNFYPAILDSFVTSSSSLCAGFVYYPISNTSNPRYCMACPAEADLPTQKTIQNFKYPFKHGIDFGNFIFAYSGLNTGATSPCLIAYSYLNATSALTPAPTVTIVSITSNPSVIYTNDKNCKVILNLELGIELPSWFLIQIVPQTVLNWNKIAFCNLESSSNPTLTYSCAGGMVSGNGQFNISTSGVSQSGYFTLIYYIDVGTITPVIEFFGVQIYVQGISSVVLQQNTTSLTATKLLYTTSTVSGSMHLANLNFEFPVLTGKSQLSFFVNITGRTVSSLTALQLAASDLAIAGAQADYSCRIYFQNGSLVHDFQLCEIQNGFSSGIAIIPKSNINTEYGWTVVIDGVLLPSISPISTFNVTFIRITDSQIIFSGTMSYSFFSSNIALSQVQMKKFFNFPGIESQMQIFFTTTHSTISANSTIYLLFPSYYPHNFGSQNLYCTVNSTIAHCKAVTPRVLKIYSISTTIQGGALISIVIQGIETPQIVSARDIYIMLQGSSGQSFETGFIHDVNNEETSAQPFYISSFSLGSLSVARQTTLSLSIFIESNLETSPNALSIQFPDAWGPYPQTLIPYFDIYLNGSTAAIPQQGTLIGSTLILPFSETFQSGDLVIVNVSNVWSGSYYQCDFIPPKVMITSNIEQTLIQNGIYNTEAIQQNYETSDSLLIQFEDGTTAETVNVTIGVFSQYLVIKPISGKFVTDITLTPSDSSLVTYPSSLFIPVGTSTFLCQVGYNSGVSSGTYVLSFTKTESGTTTHYNNLESIVLNLESTNVEIPVPGVMVQQGGLSNPIIFSLENMRPINNLIISMGYSAQNGQFFTNKTLLIFNQTHTRDYFQVQVLSSVQIGTSISINLFLEGNNSFAYSFSPSSTLSVSVSQSTTSALSITGLSLINKGEYVTTQTYQVNFSSSATEEVSVYWAIFASTHFSSPFSNCSQLKKLAPYHQSFAIDDPMQLQTYTDTTSGLSDTITWQNLRSNELYTVLVCGQDQNLKYSKFLSTTFRTKSNQADMHKFSIYFTKTMNQQQLESTICYLAYQFQVKKSNIFSDQFQGTQCKNYSSYYTAKTSSTLIHFYTRGDAYSELTDNTKWKMQTFSHNLGIPNSEDTINFVNFLQGLSSNLNYESTHFMPHYSFTQPILGYKITPITSPNILSVEVLGSLMNSEKGFIQSVILLQPIIDVPTPYQIMMGTDAYNNPVPSGMGYYNGLNTTSYNISTGLKLDTSYAMYFIGTSLDMSDIRQATQPYQKPFGIPYVIYLNSQLIIEIEYIFLILISLFIILQ